MDIDSLRPDHLGCYGYGRATSPNIDRVAARGVRMENVYVSDMPCAPSRTSMFSGRLGIRHGCIAHHGRRSEPFSEGAGRDFKTIWNKTSWMRQLRDAGYTTATISSFGERHSAYHWYAGFEQIHDTGHHGHEIADDVTPVVIDWLERQADKPDWFLHVNYWDVHVPYRTPKAYGNRFENEPLEGHWQTQEILDAHQGRPGIRSTQDALFLSHAEKRPDLNPPTITKVSDVKKIIDAYDTAINYVDDHIGLILAQLEKQGLLDETAIIIGADHGECLGELGAYGGHCFADEHTAHVPMVIHWPGVTDARAGEGVESLCYHLDLSATICDLIGTEKPEQWDAQSFLPAIKNDEQGRDVLVCSQLAQSWQRSVRFDHEGEAYLYLKNYHDGFSGFPEEMLFNLTQDRHEVNNIIAVHSELQKFAAGQLDQWLTDLLERSDFGDPLEEQRQDLPSPSWQVYRRRLEKRGMQDVITELEANSASYTV